MVKAMPDVSIIIPIYNTPQAALLRCFDSLQSLSPSWEAVLVDDGSEESVGQFCREYAENHPNFRYFYKENGGVSSARNFGLQEAAGTYVMFVDADDMLLGNPIALLPDQADLTVYDMQLAEGNSEHTWHSLPMAEGAVEKPDFLRHLLSTKDLNSPCVKLFRTALIRENGLQFRPDFITGEDWLFVTEFSSLATSFRYVRQSCYRYFRDEATGSSRLARFPDTMLDNCARMYAKKLEVMAQQSWSAQILSQIRACATAMMTEDLFNSAAELLLLNLLTPQRRKLILDTVRSGKDAFPGMPLKTRLKAFVLLRFPAGLWLLAKLRQLYLRIK